MLIENAVLVFSFEKAKHVSGNPISVVYLFSHLQDVNLSNTFPYAIHVLEEILKAICV